MATVSASSWWMTTKTSDRTKPPARPGGHGRGSGLGRAPVTFSARAVSQKKSKQRLLDELDPPLAAFHQLSSVPKRVVDHGAALVASEDVRQHVG